jgi:hypothetical protein
MVIFKKRESHVCAQACADGSKEKIEPGYKKEDGTSPMVATNSILISTTMDTPKGRKVATTDISGAFPNAYNDKETIMLLEWMPGQTDGPG